jgi:cell division protein FtsW
MMQALHARNPFKRWFGPREEQGEALPVQLGARHSAYTHSQAGVSPQAAPMQTVDMALIWVVGILLTWGLVMVYSASIAMPDNPKFAGYSHTHFLSRHILSITAALVAALLAFQVPLEKWERWAPALFVVSLVLLALVLVPGLSKDVNGAKRWLKLGPTNFQPSELGKLAVLLYAANYMVRKMDVKEDFFRAVMPMGIAVVAMGVLLLWEPDMGAFLVIAVIAMGILFLGGVNVRMFASIAAILLIAFGLMIALSEWRRERIFAYLDPWAEKYALGKGYQLSHSLIAIGRGEIFGVGLGGSVEKLHWLPEAHTDFLLAVIGEELGLVGVVVLIGMFLWLTRRIMHIGRRAIALDRVFAGLVAEGVAIWMGFQAFINMGVNLGALPTKGLTLPLMSYGGSAILINLVALAIVLRVEHENRRMMQGGRS